VRRGSIERSQPIHRCLISLQTPDLHELNSDSFPNSGAVATCACCCTAAPASAAMPTPAAGPGAPGEPTAEDGQPGSPGFAECSDEPQANEGPPRLPLQRGVMGGRCRPGVGAEDFVLGVRGLSRPLCRQVRQFYCPCHLLTMGRLKSAVAILRRMISINSGSRLLATKIDEATAGASERDQDRGIAAAC